MKMIKILGCAGIASVAMAVSVSSVMMETAQAKVVAGSDGTFVHRVTHTLASDASYSAAASGNKWAQKNVSKGQETNSGSESAFLEQTRNPWSRNDFSEQSRNPWSRNDFSEQSRNPWSRNDFSEQSRNPWSRNAFFEQSRNPWSRN